ncbi:hypothetical protein DOE76_14855 [Leifsonia sp. ku-ls]|nr:hypothetical protein DOE76_14855 [Leifsonia sp. ku-ls]
MRVLRAGEKVWLVVDDVASRIHFVIEYGPAVNQRTHETLMKYRVDHWTLRRSDRWPLGFYDELRAATMACELAVEQPSFVSPVTAPDGTIVTADEQRARWHAGLDPRTGKPRTSR